jgi:hypothetical protein
MWKRIRSNRNPEDTLYTEIKKEFKPYFEKAGNSSITVLQRSPKVVFVLMVFLILISLIMTFTVFRHPEPKANPVLVLHPIHDGFDEILKAGAQLKETIRLKKLVDSISAKKQLSETDSVTLVQALDSLQHIHPSFK